MGQALATGCTLEHVAAVTGFDHQTIERLPREPRNDFNGRHPTDRHAPDRSSSTGDAHPARSIFVFRVGFLAKTSNYLVTLTNFLFEPFRLTHHGVQIGGQTSISPRQGINCCLQLSLLSPHHHDPALPLRVTSTAGT